MNEQEECNLLRQLRATPRVFEILRNQSGPELRLQKELRAEFSDDIVRAAIQLTDLRRKARVKFSRADEMWFDRIGLEQATSEPVARHKSQRFTGQVWDYCCGIGGDLVALAERCDVIGVDRSSATCLRARWNAEAYGVSDHAQLIAADIETLTDRTGWLHIDPDRRPENRSTGRRALRVEECTPGLEQLRRLMREFTGGAIKLSPAANFAGKFNDVEIELVSLSGECKEATIWFGGLASHGTWRATVLPENATLAGNPLSAEWSIGELQGYLYDPDPAIVRSGLVGVLAEQTGLLRLDSEEEYLTSPGRITTPFAQVFEVLADLPNNDREIRAYFRQNPAGQVEIKCRHVRVEAERVRRKLPLTGSDAAVLIFARVNGRTRGIVCRRPRR